MVRKVRKLKGKGIKELMNKAKDFLQRTKIISRTADHFKPHLPAFAYPISTLAKSYGYGKKSKRGRGAPKRGRGAPKRKRLLRGSGFMDWIKKASDWLKKTKIISSVGSALGTVLPVAGTIGNIAGAAGYGRRRKRMTGRGLAPQSGSGYGGSPCYSVGVVGYGKIGMRGRGMRGRGIGHLNTPYSSVGISGAASYSSGRVSF